MKTSLPYFIILIFCFSCTDIEKKGSTSEEIQAPYAAPVIVLLDTVPPPKKVELKNVPPPRVIMVPKTSGGTYSINSEGREEKINLKLPVITKVSTPIAHFTNFSTEDGLAYSAISCGWQDKKGQLWFGTYGGGISRYDGTGFTTFNTEQGLAGSEITCIGEDNDGNLWFGTTNNGLSRYDGIGFITYTTANGLADNTISSIVNDKNGKLWFATLGGVSCYDGTKFTTIDTSNALPKNTVTMIAEDKNGNLWFATFGGGVCRYDGKNFSTFTTRDGLPTNYVLSVAQDGNGNLWFGTHERGVVRYGVRMDDTARQGKIFTTYTTEDGLANNTVNAIAVDEDGNPWFATNGGGVSRYDGKKFTTLTTEQGLANNTVHSITKDKYGNLWFGTYGGGVSRYNGKALSILTSKQGLPENMVMTLREDKKGNLWFGTFGSGVICYDGKQFINFTTSQGLADNTVSSIGEDKDGNLWFGTKNFGVSRYDGTSFTTYTTTQGLAQIGVFSITEDKNGNLWFGTYGRGISRFDGVSFTTFTTEQGLPHYENGLADYPVGSIIQDKKGDIWFGTSGGGVSRYNGKSFTTFTTAQGLAHNFVTSIIEDKSGNLWFGTFGGGISRYDGSSFTSFTTSQGLPDNNVISIVEDEQGALWIGTNKGFSGLKFKTPINENQPPAIREAGLLNVSNEQLKNYEPVWEIFNIETGYPVKDLVYNACIKKLKLPYGNKEDVGTFWAGCGDAKVIRFEPKAVNEHIDPPPVFIQSVKVNEATVNWYSLSHTKKDRTVIAQQETMVYGSALSAKVRDSLQKKFADIQFDSITAFYPLPENLELPYRHNRVSFDFGAIETNRNFMVRYQYILEGYDKEWNPVTEKNSASFGNISEGTYKFKLKARSPEGIWSEPIVYSFKVLPPWWRTWWAYVSYILSFAFAIYAIIHWRTKTLQKEKIHLEKKVNQRTMQLEHKSSELQQSLENLKATQSQLIQSEKMASLGELTAGIAHEIQNPLNFVNNFSEVNTELIDELEQQAEKGNVDEIKTIAKDIKDNEQKILHHGQRADAIVKSMLQHSKKSTGQKEPTNINALADEYLRLSYHGMRAKDKSFSAGTKVDFDNTIGKIDIVPQDIGRVLLNLYNNAFYAVAEKMNASTSLAGHPYEPTVSVSTKKTGDKILISVKDNGNGIPQKILDKIFQPFFTTKPTGQGTGLGLSLSYDIVKAHGGEIKVTTKEHEGSEFIIQLQEK